MEFVGALENLGTTLALDKVPQKNNKKNFNFQLQVYIMKRQSPRDRRSCLRRVDEQRDERRTHRRWRVAATHIGIVRCSVSPGFSETR